MPNELQNIDFEDWNNFQNGIATLELAKILKKYGFDGPCEYYYLDKDLPFVKKGLKKTKNNEKMNHNKYDDYIYSAPTPADIIYWKFNSKTKDKLYV